MLGHGAGAPMTHSFMEAVTSRLHERALSVLRYNFQYMEAGRKRPDHQKRLTAVVASALAAGRDAAGDLPLFAGGKSMGGRMTSLTVSGGGYDHLAGLVFFGFPLHAPGRDESHRADHLDDVPVPMLFLQGTRDRLAKLDLLRPVLKRVGPRATLHVEDDADHSFHVPKRSGRTDDEVLDRICDVTADWTGRLGS